MRHQAGQALELGPWPGVAWRIRDEHGTSRGRTWRMSRARSKKLLWGGGRPLLGSGLKPQKDYCGFWERTDCRAGRHRRTGIG